MFGARVLVCNNEWVSPFGHHRIKGSWLLPGEYRCLRRPSSVTHTKASTVCVSKTFLRPFHSDCQRTKFASNVRFITNLLKNKKSGLKPVKPLNLRLNYELPSPNFLLEFVTILLINYNRLKARSIIYLLH